MRAGDSKGQDPVVAVAFGGNNTSGPIDVATARTAHSGPHGRLDFETETFVDDERGAEPVPLQVNGAAGANGAGIGSPAIPMLTLQAGAQHGVAIAFDTTQITSPTNRNNPKPGDPCHPLAAAAHPPAIAFNGRMDPVPGTGDTGALDTHASTQCVAHPTGPVAIDLRNGTEDEVAMSLQSGGMGEERGLCPNAIPHTVAFTCKDHGADATSEASPTLRAMGHANTWANGGGQVAVATAWAVRRLTPVECARLQGFPDDYLTQVPWRGKAPPPDGPMYRALGNSFARNVVQWIAQRIDRVTRSARGEAA